MTLFDILVKYQLEPEIYSFGILNEFKNYLERSAINSYPVHIKLDTGMHRLGFETKDLFLLIHDISFLSCVCLSNFLTDDCRSRADCVGRRPQTSWVQGAASKPI